MPGYEANLQTILAAISNPPFTVTDQLNQRGFIAWTGAPQFTNAVILASQSEVAIRLNLPQGGKITGAAINISVGGSTLTGGQSLITLYDANGNLVGQTPDQSGVWTGTGNKYASFTGGPFTLPSGYCYASLLCNGTTPATVRSLGQTQGFSAIGPGADLAGSALLYGRIGSAVTAPASFSPSTLVQTGAQPWWIGLY